jgi:ABC-2 type transport system ATP-binding protein
MASHLLDEVEKVCTHVAILKQGTLITHGDVNEILVNEDMVEISAADLNHLQNTMMKMPGTSKVDTAEKVVRVFFPSGQADLSAINQFCFNNGIILSHLQLKKKSLESKFFELTN